ncbi:protein ZW2-like [Silene latifolia]|uniref:protein ZW2-like n=1 Tax=Silene latifolia TaxID=37657 RepID=UPI003D77F6CF
MSSSSSRNFHEFFTSWLERQQVYVDELVDASNDPNNPKEKLVEKVLLHYEEYYEEKYKVIASDDIFQLFAPPWLTTFEKAFLWIGGLFKPSLLLRMTEMAVSNMTPSQIDELKVIKAEVVRMEKKGTDGLAKVQESMAASPLTELAKNWRKLVNGEASDDFDEATVKLMESLGKLVVEADNLRRYAVAKLVEILNMEQMVVVLAAIGRYQLRIRGWGVVNDLSNPKRVGVQPNLGMTN